MRWWCPDASKQRRRDRVEKPTTQDVGPFVGSTGPALLLGDGSGALWKVYGISRRPLSPWSAAVPPGVFHGNFDLTDAEDVAKKLLTGITHFYVPWRPRRTGAPAREVLRNALSLFVSNCPKRIHGCVHTVGAALPDNIGKVFAISCGLPPFWSTALLPCRRFDLTDAEDIAKPLTDIGHFYVVWDTRRPDAPGRESNCAMLGNGRSVFVSNCPKQLIHGCLQTTGKGTVGAALLGNITRLEDATGRPTVYAISCRLLPLWSTALPASSHFDLTDAQDTAKPLTEIRHFFRAILGKDRKVLSVFVSSCNKHVHVRPHTDPSSQNIALAAGSIGTNAALLDNLSLEDDLGDQLSYHKAASAETCAPCVGHWNLIKKLGYREAISAETCAPSVGHWNSVKKVLLILVIFSLSTGVDSSSTGTSSMKKFCPKRDAVSYFMPEQRKVCPIIEISSAHWMHSKRVAPGPTQQPRDTNIVVSWTLAAHSLLFLCCVAPWVSVQNLVPENGRIHRFLYFIRIETVSMWRCTLLISINFYVSMIAYGVAYGLAPKPHESTWLKNFTLLEFTTTIANAIYCLAFLLVLMLLMRRERSIFQEANMLRSWICSITTTILISIIHVVICAKLHPSDFKGTFFFEKIAFVCIILMYLFRWFTMVPTSINVFFNLCAIISGIILLCISEGNNWYKWGVEFTGILCRSIELITWAIWFWIYEGRNPLIVAEQVNGG